MAINNPQELESQGTARAPEIPAVTRFWLLGVAVLMAAVATYGMWRLHSEYPKHWASILAPVAATESPPIGIQKALEALGDNSGPKFGAQLPLVEFIQANGHRVEVSMVEGQFFDQSIEPRNVWRDLGESMLLLSSVDERRANIGEFNHAATAGCGIKQESRSFQEIGTTSIDPCNDIYRKSFHIRWLARLSAIVETSGDSARQPCWNSYGIAVAEGDYQACVSNAVSDGLKSLFSEMRRKQPIDALVMPAVGTGIGKLSKAGFYNKFLGEVLIEELKKPYDVTSKIYLQVRRGETPNRWPETRVAIAHAVSAAATKWDFDSEHKSPDSEWLSLTGVAIGCCMILVFLAFGRPLKIVSDIAPLIDHPNPLIFVAWISAAVGLVTMFKSVVEFFPATSSPYLQVVVGILTAFLCGPLIRATDDFNKSIKLKRKAKSEAMTERLINESNESGS